MSGKYSKFTVKDLADYCNKLCEEGHGNVQVVTRFRDDGVKDAELSDCLFDNNHLCLSMDHDLSWHLSDASSTLIENIVYGHRDTEEIESGIAEAYMACGMDNEVKRLLAKQWIEELL
jgi:hypothetical protein